MVYAQFSRCAQFFSLQKTSPLNCSELTCRFLHPCPGPAKFNWDVTAHRVCKLVTVPAVARLLYPSPPASPPFGSQGTEIVKELIKAGYSGFSCVRSSMPTRADKALSAESGVHWHVGKEVPIPDMIRMLNNRYNLFLRQEAGLMQRLSSLRSSPSSGNLRSSTPLSGTQQDRRKLDLKAEARPPPLRFLRTSHTVGHIPAQRQRLSSSPSSGPPAPRLPSSTRRDAWSRSAAHGYLDILPRQPSMPDQV